jgi:hypothetical protein
MAQPIWITKPGSLGVVPEGVFYQVTLQAYDPDDGDLYYVMIAGSLPDGVQCTASGLLEGIPKAIASLQGVPTEVSRDVTSTFTVRAYTEKIVNGQEVIDRIADRTFSLTVTGQNVPEFVTPAGNIGTYYDGTKISIQIQTTDPDPDDFVSIKLLSGALPPGVVVSKTGLISGLIQPLVGPPGTAEPGFDSTPKDEYPNDFTLRSASKNYQFALEVTDGKDSNVRTYEIYVYSKDSMSADTTDFTADNTWITADVVPTRTPVLITPSGSLGTIRADNNYYFQYQSVDFDGDAVEYLITDGLSTSPPPGLSLDSDTGWLYGYIPDQGVTETTYDFSIQVRKKEQPLIISEPVSFAIAVVGNIETDVTWLSEPDLGTIDNGAISMFTIQAINTGGRALEYRLVSGTSSKLPQGLTLLPSGNIVGKVSFNTFALDGGTTTFDVNLTTRLEIDPTTFDLTCSFDVNAFAPQTEQLGFEVSEIVVTNGGTGYVSQPTITISAPPPGTSAIQATVGVATIVGGVITAVAVNNPGRGYTAPPTITITGGGGSNAQASSQLTQSTIINSVSAVRRFTILINRAYNTPYESLYIQCMPPRVDRQLISNLLENQAIISREYVYRPDDSNFGVAQDVVYVHAYGLKPATIDTYFQSLQLNHYWRNLTLGKIKTAQALDAAGNIIYEVIYSQIIDDLVNNQGVSVGKEVELAYPIVNEDSSEITQVYPNSLPNMRNQVISTVGQITPGLPLWMTSKQKNGQVLGFTPAWVIAYIKPGQSSRVAYYINENIGESLNTVDFEIDRYELDRSQTHNWNPVLERWIPSPPEATTFDNSTTYFDYRNTTFIAPADRWTNTATFDKYLAFPKINILG